jgi:predicted amidohydrolase YtcJ
MKTRYTNGHFYLMTNAEASVQEIWTEDGIITSIGPQPTWHADRVIDLQGSTGFPGFVDSHLHLIGYGETLSLLQLHKNPDPRAVLALVRQRFQGTYLYCQGHVEQQLTKLDLDKISTTVPILLRHADFHGATVNSAVLKQIGLSSHPTGILHEAAALKAVQSLPKYRQDDLVNMMRVAIQQLHAFGITGGHTDDLYYFNGFHEVVSAYQKFLTSSPFRTHLLVHHLELDAYEQVMKSNFQPHPLLEFGAVGEIFYDGTLSSQTALMHHPYQGSQGFGERQFTAEQWLAIVKRVRALGLPLAVHAIGDLALDEVVDTLIAYPVKTGLHDRIIHASLAKQSIVDKLKKIPVMLDIQPQFIPSDLSWASTILSPETELIYPFKTYANQGLILCGGSDAPVEIPNPLLGIDAAYRRLALLNQHVYQPEERLSIFEAIKLYTMGANAPSYDGRRGTLKVGNLADFTCFDMDILRHPETLQQAKTTLTVVDDQIVYTTLNQ